MDAMKEEEEKAAKAVEEEEAAAEEKKEDKGKAVEKAAEDDGREGGRSRGRSRSRSRSRSGKKKSGGKSGDSDSESRSRSRSRKKRRSKSKHNKRKKKRRRSSSSSSSDSDAGWEKKFLATAMENAQKARMGMVPGGANDPAKAGADGAAAASGVSGNKAIGRFFDNQGRFINPAGGFNPSGAPRRIPKEHGQWGDWECEACGGHNRKHRTSCFTCFVPKPTEAKSAHYTTSVGGRAMKD